MPRWLAIDYGTRRIGVALCDREERIASPIGRIDAIGTASGDAAAIARLIEEHAADAVVVGLPLNMDGSTGPQAALSTALAEALTGITDKPVELFDERLTSFTADQRLAESGLSPTRRRALRDSLAAQALLEAFLAYRRARP